MIFLKGEAMSTTIRPELSINGKYYVEKHRYYELKHFCLQYPLWKKTLTSLGEAKYVRTDISSVYVKGIFSDPTADHAEEKIFYSERVRMIEDTVKQTAPEPIANYLLRGVTEGVSYEYLKAKLNIPCCRDKYYELYRKFFYLLSIERQ